MAEESHWRDSKTASFSERLVQSDSMLHFLSASYPLSLDPNLLEKENREIGLPLERGNGTLLEAPGMCSGSSLLLHNKEREV